MSSNNNKASTIVRREVALDVPTGKINIGITHFTRSKSGKTCLFVNKILNAENENPFEKFDILLKLNGIDLMKYYLQDTSDGIKRIEKLFGRFANEERKVTVSRKFEKKEKSSDVEKKKRKKKNNRKKKAKTEGSVSSGANSASTGGRSSLSTSNRKPATGGSRKPSAGGSRSNKDNQSLPSFRPRSDSQLLTSDEEDNTKVVIDMASMSSAAAPSRAAPRSSKKKSDVSSAASSQSGAGSRSTVSSGTNRLIWPDAATSILYAWEQEDARQGPEGKKYRPQVTLKAVKKIKSKLLTALLTNPKNDWARDIEDKALQSRVKQYMERGRWKLDPLPRAKAGEGPRHENQKKKNTDASSVSSRSSGASGHSVMTRTTTTDGVNDEIQSYLDENCIEEDGTRRQLHLVEVPVIVAKIKPLLAAHVDNKHVNDWDMNRWQQYIRNKIVNGQVKTTRISGINQGKTSAEVNGQCSGKDGTCAIVPYAPLLDCTQCAYEKLEPEMISEDDSGVLYSYLNEDRIRVVALLEPGESTLFLSGRPKCKKTGIVIQFHTSLAIQGLDKMSPMERYLKTQELDKIITERRESRSNAKHARRECKIDERKKQLEDAIQNYAPSDAEATRGCSPDEYIKYMDPAWADMINGDDLLSSKSAFIHSKRSCSISPILPKNLQRINGQPPCLLPNILLSLAILEQIPHCTSSKAANKDTRAWAGCFGFVLTYMFFFGHYSQWYKYSHGRTYCLYICTAGNHKVMSRIEQFKFDGGNVNPRHAGLCEFNTNEKQRKEGPFMAFDIAASFKMPADGLPTSCQFTLLCVRDADGTMHEVELDLSKPHACLSATIGGGIVYDPNQDPSKAAKAKSNNSVDLTDSPPTKSNNSVDLTDSPPTKSDNSVDLTDSPPTKSNNSVDLTDSPPAAAKAKSDNKTIDLTDDSPPFD